VKKWKMPMILTCEELDQFMVDYLDRKLSSWQRFKFRFHILLCPKCKAFLDSYQKTIEIEKRTAAAPARPTIDEAPEDLIRAILAARPKK
jgi:hypothetical protein